MLHVTTIHDQKIKEGLFEFDITYISVSVELNNFFLQWVKSHFTWKLQTEAYSIWLNVKPCKTAPECNIEHLWQSETVTFSNKTGNKIQTSFWNGVRVSNLTIFETNILLDMCICTYNTTLYIATNDRKKKLHSLSGPGHSSCPLHHLNIKI